MAYVHIRRLDMLVIGLFSSSTAPDPTEILEIETDFSFNAAHDYRYNEGDSTFYDVGPKKSLVNPEEQKVLSSPFSSKKTAEGKSLYRRKHGIASQTITAGQSGTFELTVPYDNCKITEAEIVGARACDTVNLKVLDTPTGAISTYPNAMLNQFGFNVHVAKDFYKDKSDYDADLIKDMKIQVILKNNHASDPVTVGINIVLHEVK